MNVPIIYHVLIVVALLATERLAIAQDILENSM